MSFFFLSIFFLFSLFNQVFSSPVLLWSNVNLPRPAAHFGTVSSMNFIEDAICALNSKQIEIRLVAVQDLNIEDIQRGSQRNHPILSDAKKDKSDFRFYPNVADDIHSKLSLIPQSNSYKCSHIHFKISSSKTYENFEDALNILQATVESINKNKPTLIILTSTTKSHQRRAIKASSNQVLISSDGTCMLHVGQLIYNNVSGSKHNSLNYSLDYSASSCLGADANRTAVNLNLVWINAKDPSDTLNMLLTTVLGARYWYLRNATIDAVKHYRYFAYGMHDRMDTPPGYCYVCNSAVFVRYEQTPTLQGGYNFSDKFYLTEFQFQPYKVNGSRFGNPNYCTSFFTSGIWMGITSSLLCLAILLFGIHRMMTIKSNDRFDDPKGKPLFIKAQE